MEYYTNANVFHRMKKSFFRALLRKMKLKKVLYLPSVSYIEKEAFLKLNGFSMWYHPLERHPKLNFSRINRIHKNKSWLKIERNTMLMACTGNGIYSPLQWRQLHKNVEYLNLKAFCLYTLNPSDESFCGKLKYSIFGIKNWI